MSIRNLCIIIGVLLFIYIVVFSKNGLLSRRSLVKQENKIREEVQKLEKEVQKNEVVVSQLKSDSIHIEKLAREKYGMIKPSEKYFQIKNEGGN